MATVTVFCEEYYNLPDNLLEFMKLLNKSVGQIPDEFLENAEIEFHLSMEWDSPTLDIEVSYSRPSTEAEDAKEADVRRKQLEGELARHEGLVAALKKRLTPPASRRHKPGP